MLANRESGSWRKQTGIETVSMKKRSQPVGTKSDWRAGVGQGLGESILQGGGVPLSDMCLRKRPVGTKKAGSQPQRWLHTCLCQRY